MKSNMVCVIILVHLDMMPENAGARDYYAVLHSHSDN